MRKRMVSLVILTLGVVALVWIWLFHSTTTQNAATVRDSDPSDNITTRSNARQAIAAMAQQTPVDERPASHSNGMLDPTVSVTVSGTVTGPDGAVSDVWIGVGSPQDWQEITTNASGFYSLSIHTDGQLWFHIRPDVSSRLTQANLWMEGVSSDFTQNFTLTEGNLLSLRLIGKDSAPVTGDIWFEMQPLQARLSEGYWYSLEWDDNSQRYRAVVPTDIFYVTARHLPAGYFETTQAFDLRIADQVADMQLSTVYVHPIPYDPPVAGKISISPPDDLGETDVSGGPGATQPWAHVFLVNLNSSHQAHTFSDADGSFSARIYAPPGSAIMIKHGPPSPRWNDLEVGISEGLNPFPGTIINVPHSHTGDAHNLPFAAAGAIEHYIDDSNATRNYVASAWAITGTIGPVVGEGEWNRVLTGTYDGQVVPGLYLGGLNWTHPALGDLENDGDLDLVVGEDSGRLVLYRNRGNATTPNWQFEASDFAGVATEWWAYPVLVDVTNDGILDLFVGEGNGTVSIYYASAVRSDNSVSNAPIWPESPDISLTVGPNAAPTLDDLDSDGDLDLLVGHEGGTLYHYENTGTIADPLWTHRSDSYGGINEASGWLQPAFVDLDGDGDRDLLVGLCGQLIWYERSGSPPIWTRVDGDPIGYGGGSCGTSPAVGDWDGDSDNDLIVGEHWGVLRFFRRNGPTSWSEPTFSFPFDLHGESAPAVADWNDDGDLDLLLGQVWGDVHQYTNLGSAANPDWRPDGVRFTVLGPDHPHAFPTFADIDGDNDYDLFIGEGGWQSETGAGGNIHYYRNDGTPSSPNWTQVTTYFLGLDVGGWSTPVFVDIDDDDDLDLFVGDEAGTLTYVRNTGTVTAPTWAAPIQPYDGLDLGSYSAPAFIDVDQDNDLDLLVGLENGSLAYVRNIGNARDPAWQIISAVHPGIDVGHRSTPTAADINGDGWLDLLIGDIDGGLNVFLYEGPGTPQSAADTYAPGDPFQIAATIRLHSQGITSTTDISEVFVSGGLSLLMLYNQDGQPIAADNYIGSTRLTPSGLPILHTERAAVGLNADFTVSNLRHTGDHTIIGDLSVSGQIPKDLPPGVFRPFISLGFANIPTSTEWLAANVVYHTFHPNEAPLPPIKVGWLGNPSQPRLSWHLLMDDLVQGTRGTGARQDEEDFQIASFIVSQGAPYYTPPLDVRSGQPITYRLEPFLPMISFTDRRMPTPPLIPFDLPGGQLCVQIREPDATVRDLGCEPFAQSFNRTKTTRGGDDLNGGTVQVEDVYSLMTESERFRVTFGKFGHHVITMTGMISDIWGNSYKGGGAYDVWMAHPLDIDPGVLPGTPFGVGDAFNPAAQFYPRVPAEVRLNVTQYPDSDPTQATTQSMVGQANLYGYVSSKGSPITFTQPGEYRVDLTAIYTDASAVVYLGAMTWGGVVMTPESKADLFAHGRRGVDFLSSIPNHWFVSCRDLSFPPGAIGHTLNPYFNGDIIWSRLSDNVCGGDSLVLGASVQDTVGAIEAAIWTRANRMYLETSAPGNLDERFSQGEIPLFSSTRSGRPVQLVPSVVDGATSHDIDQIAYSFRYSQRPGVRVRELVAEDGHNGGYWRLNTLYDDQLGVGILGDQPNDYKFQYVGVVFRDLETGHNEYAGQGSGWIFIPDDDLTGSRVMPPFAGPGNGGWTKEGGPLLILKDKKVHIFILPTGTRPGAVLQTGDSFRFAGHIMPTLNSSVTLTVTAPSGTQYIGGGRANSVGYYYDQRDDFVVDEPGLWSVDVLVWHDGQCSGGATIPPYPSGDVLGSENGRYWFYVVPRNSPRLNVTSPLSGFLSLGNTVTPINITGTLPPDLNHASLDYTISMPGYILVHDQIPLSGDTYQITFDPVILQQDFPNLDLIGRDSWKAGLADTFAIGLLMRGQQEGRPVYRANTITMQGEQVFIGDAPPSSHGEIYLPLMLNGG